MISFRSRWNVLVLFTVSFVLLSACASSGSGKSSAGSTAAPTSSTAPSASAKPKQWSKAPDMIIDPKKSYEAEITTSKGKFTIQLFAKEAPKTVNNFVFLAKQGFYDNVIFHRIIKSFMIQTGDPLGNGSGGPGYRFADELNTPYKYEEGTVAMANSGPDTNGSQFFICTGPDAIFSLNARPNYTIFGIVTSGIENVQKIADTPVKMNPGGSDTSPSMPTEKVTIQSISIKEK
ncbi:peptidylprolyl isomerase [Paenibacillus sp. GP183]|jgi:cyclophilin family peptidyl-prolyl cis-trans isomerase|uniref:peptidylprolyl isomerase n=1 Tax=Paenibacillus sp. GP183 TaxID=1882751 RepID=UPI000894D26E|nr:peptidylprolyl isomerase [Paenibacillus sp. GP183]SEB59799.1 Peptidyl-prolyl cis-trans isomerase (rotamase)-cyclophilin family [Paenibacillus sp. GP183]